jgi:hypothetical protein
MEDLTMEEKKIIDLDFEDFIHDSPEDIQKCLNCTKEECTNCLWMND